MILAMIAPSKPPKNVIPSRNWHFQWLAERMRPDEIEHWLAISGAKTYDPDVAAAGFINTPGIKFTVLDRDGQPASAGGFHEVQPGVWEAWMIGSIDGWSTTWRSMTKAARWLMGQLFEAGARRLFISTIATRNCATDWYRRSLGMSHEGTLRRAGHHGEDMVFYARLAGEC